MKNSIIGSMFVIAGGLVSMSMAVADEYPTEPLTIIVNYKEGGAVDRTARSLQAHLPEFFGEGVNVENIGGSSGKDGVVEFNERPADGQTALVAFSPAVTAIGVDNPDIYNLDDLAVINVQWSDPAILIARKDTGWTTFEEMVSDIRANPGKYVFGSSGKAAVGPLLALELFEELDLDVKVLSYKGGGNTRKAFLGGEVHLTAAGAGAALPVQDESNIMGAFWDKPVEGWPDAKPINELLRPFDVSVPNGAAYRFLATRQEFKDKHPELFDQLAASVKDTTLSEKFQTFAAEKGIGADWLGPEASEDLLREVDAEFAPLIKKRKGQN